MYPVVGQCPVCGEALIVTRLHCRACDTTIEGQFTLGRLTRLSPEQMAFVELFIRCEGKINRMEKELNVSYPTVRARLDDVILALGYRPAEGDAEAEVDEEEEEEMEEEIGIPDEARRRVLDDLAEGRITAEQAAALLRPR